MNHLTDEQKKELRGKLEEELQLVTQQLERVGRKNPDNPADWEAKPDDTEGTEADRNVAADRIESYEENTAILKDLETRFNNVKDALARMDDGSYGVCEVSGKPIELARLQANPAARTCTKHMEGESG